MKFEQMANELLLDIFEYLASIDNIRSFFNLNFRLNDLVIIHIRSHGLNFRSISKYDFENIYQKNARLIADHITALQLSDDDDTPEQINIFLSHGFSFRRLVQLKSLSLYNLSSNELIDKLARQFRHLVHLTHLDFINCHMIFDEQTQHKFINGIWRLPKLTHCHLDFQFRHDGEFFIPTIRSKSIECLTIKNTVFNADQLIRLFRCTPYVRYLMIHVDELANEMQFPFRIKSIFSSKLIVNHLTDGTMNLLKNLPNLTKLTLHIGKSHLNGHQWKQFIIDYLPKLKIFRFLMFFSVNNEEEINEFFNSYRTSFWIIDHQWFVRCHWTLEENLIWTYFYTLPYSIPFYNYVLQGPHISTKSTCPNENDYYLYNRVTTLKIHFSRLYKSFQSDIYFNNLRHLEVTLPLSDRFLNILSRLDQLISLRVSTDSNIDADLARSHLQMLINRSPRLHTLTIAYWDSSIIQDLPLSLTSHSIRRLDLQSYHYLKRDRCFNDEQCKAFLHSSLAKQCEVLQIVLDNRSNIDYLINGMDNLKALKVVLQLDQSKDYFSTREDMITWMISSYSRTFTENLIGTETVRLWIR